MENEIQGPEQKATRLHLRLGFLAVMYLVIRFGLTGKLDEIGPYATYIFEAILVGTITVALRHTLRNRFRIPRFLWFHLPFALAAGSAVYAFSTHTGIDVPIDLSSREILLFLFVIAPLLEEGVFHFLLWEPLKNLWNNKAAYIITTLIFAYSHFHAKWFVPAEYHGFIHYQTLYTIGLGAWAGYFIWRYNSLASAILLHLAFNVGFYLGFAL
jgi:membrane protease YdiL (CAAX protease family)